MKDQFKNMMIGIFVLSALAIIVFMIFFLHPYIGDEGITLRVRFTDIDKVNVGTRVTFAGKPIGEVIEITELDDVKNTRTVKKGEIYVFELKLGVDSGTKVFNTDRISLRTSGLLGERSVAIDPEPLKPGQKLRLVNHEIIYAEQSGSVEETFAEFKQVADRFDKLLDLVTNALVELAEQNTWKNVASAIENINEITTNLTTNWQAVDDTINNLADTTDSTKEIAQNIRDGKGTIGRLASTDELYLNMSALMSKGQTILDDINHYGLLFQNDKGWQRLRARRMNLLQRLQTPQEFRNFFNDEINQINTGLARVSMVLDKTVCVPPYACLAEDRDFQRVFAELYRKVEGLEESLKMYNIQVMDERSKMFELKGNR
jgi:phospholipid/cholesterol/gamma-HCH transport system substrate-binding protein